jgi:hypothetical protein
MAIVGALQIAAVISSTRIPILLREVQLAGDHRRPVGLGTVQRLIRAQRDTLGASLEHANFGTPDGANIAAGNAAQDFAYQDFTPG